MTRKPNTKTNAPALVTDEGERAPGERRAPKLAIGDDGALNLTLQDDDQLPDLFGVKTRAVANGLMLTALNALGVKGDLYRNMMAAMAVEMEPHDAVEAMLFSQQVATHAAMTTLAGKVMDAQSPQLRESYERSMTRLSRTFLAQMDALKRYRAKAQQVVRVERVTVNEGGQAIVGAVAAGGRGDGKTLR